MKALIGERAHLEKRRGKPDEAADYCKKEGDWTQKGEISKSGQRNDLTIMAKQMLGGMSATELLEHHEDNFIKNAKAVESIVGKLKHEMSVKNMKSRLENVQLREWQRRVYNILKSDEVHPRRVYWIWDKTGNKGKSFLATYCTATLDCIIFENGKSADLKYAYNGQRVVIFDFSRMQEEQINYQVMESIKNGRVFSAKYESKMKVFDPPHVICFANFEPKREAMSADRWAIVDLEAPVLSGYLQ